MMTKQFLSLLRFAPADNGQGGASQGSAATAPAASGDTAPSGLTLMDMARHFSSQEDEPAAKTQGAAPVENPDTPKPAAAAPAAVTQGSDALGEGAEPTPADETAGPAGDAAEPGDEDVRPPEGVTPERQAEYQKGIDKLKARRAEAEEKATRLEAELAEAKKKLDEAAAAAKPAHEDPAKARANLPPVADPLFLANSEDEIDDIADSIHNGLDLGERLLKRLDASGEDEITVGRETFTRSALEREIAALRSRGNLVRRAERHLAQRRTSDAEAARHYPDLFPSGKPAGAVEAVLNELPELRARPNGKTLAAEIAAARAARAAKSIAKPAAKPAAAAPTPGQAAAPAKLPPVPGAVAAPAAIAPSQSPATTNPALSSGRGLTVYDLARDYAKAG